MKQTNCTEPSCRNFNRYCRLHATLNIKQAEPISKVSDKKKELDKQYKKVRSQFLKSHPFCEAKIDGCTKIATDVHHKIGKVGEENYLNDKYFLAVCRSCHSAIEANPAFARQNGFSISRLAKV